MKANKLRLGNIVMVDNPEHHPRLKGIELRVIGVEETIFKGKKDFSIRLEDVRNRETYAKLIRFIKPVKLTEDVLLRFGFVKSVRQSTKLFREYHLNHGSYRIKAIAHDDGAWLWKIDGFEFEAGKGWSLHRLQNVFHDLFDEEMEVGI